MNVPRSLLAAAGRHERVALDAFAFNAKPAGWLDSIELHQPARQSCVPERFVTNTENAHFYELEMLRFGQQGDVLSCVVPALAFAHVGIGRVFADGGFVLHAGALVSLRIRPCRPKLRRFWWLTREGWKLWRALRRPTPPPFHAMLIARVVR